MTPIHAITSLTMPPKIGDLTVAAVKPNQQQAKLKQAAEGFESLFLAKMLETMQASNQSINPDDEAHSSANQTMLSMANTAVAKQLASQGSLGIAQLLMASLQPQPHPTFGLKSMHKES